MLYLTCTGISSADLAHYGVSRAKYWVSVDCGMNMRKRNICFFFFVFFFLFEKRLKLKPLTFMSFKALFLFLYSEN